MTAEVYITRVLDELPPATPLRQQIALELRGHIAERLAGAQPLDEVLAQLGDPVALAESYLSAVPLVSAPHGRRLLAKAVDALSLAAVVLPITALPLLLEPNEGMPLVVIAAIFAVALACGLYLVVAEWRFGQTLGKYLLHLRVARESGTRISLGQSIVRQLPLFTQVFWIDALFVLFTDKRQRAFELLSKTRVVADQAVSGARD